ncbi:STAS domain-containing protein [Kitasatospora indigofera]|uniref:hypothetical protein n=1 Tax=Kitasatospora indigofera TaxID=67307 RepID=UPI0036857F3E
MTMQWHFEECNGTGVLSLSGFLSERVVDRFQGAFGWAYAHSSGAIILDLSDLRGWSPDGEAAIIDIAGKAAANRGPLVVCGLRQHLPLLILTNNAPDLLSLYPDLESALAAVGAGQPPTAPRSPT